MSTIRVLIADDQRLVRAGLRMLCEESDDLEVVGEATDGQQALRCAVELAPDVILMDLRMPGLDGIDATRHIMSALPTSKVLVLTTFDDDEHLYPALAAGAAGFLVKDTSPRELIDAIRRTADGDVTMSPHLVRRVIARATDAAAAASRPCTPCSASPSRTRATPMLWWRLRRRAVSRACSMLSRLESAGARPRRLEPSTSLSR